MLFDMRLMHHGQANRSPSLRPAMYTTYVRSWFLDSVNWHAKHTRGFDELAGPMRGMLSRLDTLDYTRMLETMLEEKAGVDIKKLQSTYFYKAVNEAGDGKDY